MLNSRLHCLIDIPDTTTLTHQNILYIMTTKNLQKNIWQNKMLFYNHDIIHDIIILNRIELSCK